MRSDKSVLNDLHVAFCFNLRRLRHERLFTQQQLADRFEPTICREVVADMELGRACPTLETLDRVARALNCDPEELLDRSEIIPGYDPKSPPPELTRFGNAERRAEKTSRAVRR